jgi:acyl-CoA synthetase (AMP-forming)/AMP-acid ligase II
MALLRNGTADIARVGDVAAWWAVRSPDRVALIDDAGRWTYAELAAAVAASGAWLAGQGVGAGDRLLVVGENCREAVALFLAATLLDAAPSLVAPRTAARELADIAANARPRCIVYAPGGLPAAQRLAEGAGTALRPVPGVGMLGATAQDPGAVADPVESDPLSRTATIIYTSGTTGAPKGVMLSHANLLFMARASGQVRGLRAEDCFYGVLPLSHTVGLSVVMLGTLLHGATLRLCGRFTPQAALSALANERISILLGVPAMYAMLLATLGNRPLDAAARPHLRLLGACGAPLDAALKAATETVFGLTLHNGYGATECSPTIAQTRVDTPRSDCSVGTPLPGVQTRLLAADGSEAAPGAVGVLQVRGPNVMKGYYRAAAETRAAIDAEGWFNTRDLALLRDGALFIVGRASELIIRAGHNVYPTEIEAALDAHPAVLQAAVIGQSIGADEEILAFVQKVPGSALTVAELHRHAASLLSPHKRPTRIAVLDTLPTAPTGKVLKAELARMATAMLARSA